MMYCHSKFGDPAGNNIINMFWTFFFDLPKVGHSELVMVRDTTPSHDVLPHQVW